MRGNAPPASSWKGLLPSEVEVALAPMGQQNSGPGWAHEPQAAL